MLPATRVFRRWYVEVADQRVRRHGQQVTLATVVQFPAKTRGTAHLVVSGYPTVWQSFPALVEHLQSELVAGAELDFLGYARRLATGRGLSSIPCEGTDVYLRAYVPFQRYMPCRRRPGSCQLCQAGRTVPRNTHRLGPFLGECRRIENDHSIGLAQVFADLTGQSLEQRLVIPRHMPDELLQALAFLVMEVGDRLAGLAFELGKKTGHVLAACRCCSGSASDFAKGSANASSRFRRPCINSGETSAWANISSNRSSSRRSMADSLPR